MTQKLHQCLRGDPRAVCVSRYKSDTAIPKGIGKYQPMIDQKKNDDSRVTFLIPENCLFALIGLLLLAPEQNLHFNFLTRNRIELNEDD